MNAFHKKFVSKDPFYHRGIAVTTVRSDYYKRVISTCDKFSLIPEKQNVFRWEWAALT